MFIFLISIFVWALPIYASQPQDCFYLFDVGQGSCHLVKYHSAQGVVGVIYDAGSSSGVMHPKFQNRAPEPDVLLSDTTMDQLLPAMSISPPRMSARQASGSASPSISPQGRVSTRINAAPSGIQYMKDEIKEKLQGINFLIIFLSHPDKDHINFLNTQVIPDGIPIMVVLCGEWLGDAASNSDGTALSQDVQAVFNFLRTRQKTYFSLPYYWDCTEEYNKIQYEEIKESIFDDDNFATLLFDLFRLQPWEKRYVPSQEFQGNLTALLTEAQQVDDISEGACQYVEQSGAGHSVYIWCLNQTADDANDQSAIISCTIPDINISFVFTGDARDLVFKRAQDTWFRRQRQQQQNSQQLLHPPRARLLSRLTNPDQHVVFLSLPHHGSEDNICPHAFEMFHPDGLLISTGSTSSFGHPSYQLIQEIRNRTQSGELEERFPIFDGVNYDFITVDKEKDGRGKIVYRPVIQKMFEQGQIPIICPNVRGTISVQTDGGNTLFLAHVFNPIVSLEDNSGSQRHFAVDYRQHTGMVKNSKNYSGVGENIYFSRKEQQFVMICQWVLGGPYYVYEAREITTQSPVVAATTAREHPSVGRWRSAPPFLLESSR